MQDDPVEADLMGTAAPCPWHSSAFREQRSSHLEGAEGMFGQGRTHSHPSHSSLLLGGRNTQHSSLGELHLCRRTCCASFYQHRLTAKQRKIFRLEFAFVTKRCSSGFHALGGFCTNYMCIAIKIAALPFTF